MGLQEKVGGCILFLHGTKTLKPMKPMEHKGEAEAEADAQGRGRRRSMLDGIDKGCGMRRSR